MNRFHWFEAKQLDRVTNFSSRVEVLKYAISNNLAAFYYCTFFKTKEYYGLEDNIKYIGSFSNKYFKALEFQVVVILKAISIILTEKKSVIMVNQSLIKHMLPALWLNKVFRRNNKFITDIRTTPTNPDTFESDMQVFHAQFKTAIRFFDGYSFITPFMEKYVMSKYRSNAYHSVTWSSGVNLDLFDLKKYKNVKLRNEHRFTVFYHGGIAQARGNLTLIKACEQLIKEGYKLELLQIGICIDKSIPNYIKKRGIDNWCKLLSAVPLNEIPVYIANADLPVLPFPNFMAWRVSSPIKLMEYLAMGKKVLAPNMEAFTNIFGNESDKIFYYDTMSQDPVAEIYKQIKIIIDKNLLNDVSPDGMMNFVKEEYTWTNQAKKLLDFATAL